MLNGLNKFVENLRSNDKILFTIMVFCETQSYLCKGVPIKDVKTFTKSQLPPYGLTYLHDAIGALLTEWIPEKRANHKLFIVTDGEDTGSKFVNKKEAISMCNTAVEQHDWVITHCDIDVGKLSCKNINSVRYDVDDLEGLLGCLSI